MGSLRVVVAGYGSIYRAGLCHVLPTSAPEASIAVVGEAGDFARASALIRLLRPDVIVTDLGFHDEDRVPIPRLADAHPEARILVLTDPLDPWAASAALAQGASGYLMRPAAPDELLGALLAVGAGETFVDPRFRPEPMHLVRGNDPHLSDREQEVLQLLAVGHTNAEVARRLVISPRTVETHRSNLQRKLGVRTRAELARFANGFRGTVVEALEGSTSA